MKINNFLSFINNKLFRSKDIRNIEKIYSRYFKFNSSIKIIKTHKNNVYVAFLKKQKIFRKFSINKSGSKKIKSDYLGLKWFCKKKKIKEVSIIKRLTFKKNLSFLDTNLIEGKKLKSWRSLKENYSYIFRILNDYNKIFGVKKRSNIHGDLTLDNIIFLKKGYFIIDWEFFTSKKQVRGYDAMYLLLSCIAMPFIVNKNFSKTDEKLFLKLLKKIDLMNINKKLFYNPFNYFRNAIKSDKILNSSLRISKKKFFPFITPKIFEKKILKLINKHY